MRRSSPLVLLMLPLAALSLSAQTTYLWQGTTGGSWNDPAKWSPAGPADGSTNIARFNSDFTGTPAVTLDNAAGFTVNQLFYDDTGASSDSSLNLNLGTGGSLTFAGTTPTATVNAGTLTINPPVTLNTGFAKAGGGTLHLAGTVTGWTAAMLNSVTAGTLRLGAGSGVAFDFSATKTAGTAIVQFDSVAAGSFTLPASYNAGVGTVLLNAAGTYDGTAGFSKTGNGTLTLNNATLNIAGTQNVAAGLLAIGSKVSGTAGFTKTGTGTLSLTGATNDFTGPVLVSAGTLQFDRGTLEGNFSSGAGVEVTVASGGTFSLVQTQASGYTNSRDFTVGSKLILNGGTLNEGSTTGGQFLRLLAATPIQVDAASTIAQSNGSFSHSFAIEGALTGTGNLSLNRANATTSSVRYLNLKGDTSAFSGDVTIGTSTSDGFVVFGNAGGWGSGDLTLTGAGSRVLIGDEIATQYNPAWTDGSPLAFTSGTLVTNGIITVGAGAVLNLNNYLSTYAVELETRGSVNINGGTLGAKGTAGTSAFVPFTGTIWNFGGTALSTVSANVQLDYAGVTFSVADAVAGPATDTTVSGVISGGQGLTKTGDGTLAFPGSQTYTGATSVTGGTLLVDGTLASATVALDGGTLGGSGILGGLVTSTASGIVSPGNSIGTLRVNAATLGGTLLVEVGLTDSDVLAVDTALLLNGATLTLNGITGAFSGSPYIIASYGSLGGTFGSTNLAAVAPDYQIDYNYGGTNRIALVQVPESGVTGLLLLGTAGLLSRRRRS